MDRWTEEEDELLASLVSAGAPWQEIAESFPGRSVDAVHSHWTYLRRTGREMPTHPDREGYGTVGRPRNKKGARSVSLSFRLHKSVAEAFESAIDLKPRHRFTYALERYIDAPPSFELAGKVEPYELERDERVAVHWGIDAGLLARAVEKSGLSRPKTAELVIEQLLEGWGFTLVVSAIERKEKSAQKRKVPQEKEKRKVPQEKEERKKQRRELREKERAKVRRAKVAEAKREKRAQQLQRLNSYPPLYREASSLFRELKKAYRASNSRSFRKLSARLDALLAGKDCAGSGCKGLLCKSEICGTLSSEDVRRLQLAALVTGEQQRRGRTDSSTKLRLRNEGYSGP